WLIMIGGFEEEEKTFKGANNELVSQYYVDEWPTVPGSDEQYYVVTITKIVGQDGSERYSIEVTPEEVQE
ncbi:MAG TPA: hypothetical protein PKX69_12425, partial [Limnochordia bacterium]|nr:hypothetical protein [Limnochordia bacterium]